jgi:hypothetical protein
MPSTLKFSQFLAETALESAVGLVPGASPTGFVNAIAPGGGGGGGSSGVVQVITQPNSFAATDVGKAVMVNNSGVYVFAVADNAADGEEVGLLVAAGNPAQFSVQQIGYVTFAATSTLLPLTPGMVYWLSDVGGASAGELSTTEPTTVGHISKPMLIADSATTGWVLDMRGYVIAAGVPVGGGGGGGATPASNLTTVITQTNTFAGGECVRINTSGLFVTAQADSEIDSDVAGFVIGTPTATTFTLQTAGFYAGPPQLGGIASYGLGQAYWLDPVNAGKMTATEPSTVGQWSRPVFIGLSATTGFILEQRSIQVGSTVTFPITTSQGGTGDTSFTPNNVIASGSTSTAPLVGIAPSTAGFVLTSNGPAAEPTFQPTSGTVVFPITVPQGGTGDVALAAYSLLAGGTTNTNPVQTVTAGANGLPLLSNGASALPSYGVLGTAGGGTGGGTFTAFSTITEGSTSTSPLVGVGPGTAGNVLTSNGAAAPSYQAIPAGTVATGGTGASSFPAFSTITEGATSTSPLVGVGPGTATFVLTSNGAGAAPSYQPAPGAGSEGLVWLASVTASSNAFVNFNNDLSATYDNYLFTFENLTAQTANTRIQMQTGIGGTPTYTTANYSYGAVTSGGTSGAGSAFLDTSGATGVTNSYVLSSTDSSTGPSASAGFANLFNANSTTNSQILTSHKGSGGIYANSSGIISVGAVTSLRVFLSSGNIATGTFKLYGYKN